MTKSEVAKAELNMMLWHLKEKKENRELMASSTTDVDNQIEALTYVLAVLERVEVDKIEEIICGWRKTKFVDTADLYHASIRTNLAHSIVTSLTGEVGK